MFVCIYIPNASGDARAALLDCARSFSPRVESTGAGAVVFDAEGLERLFGSYPDIAAQVDERVRARGLSANVAVAANADAAVCAARGFTGITVLNRGTEARRLSELPLQALDPPPDILETVERWGIRTLGAFAGLSPVQVSERLGREGVRMHKLARGAGSRPLTPHADPPRFVEVMDLDYEIVTIEPLTFILSRMLEAVCSRLTRANRATHEIHLSLGASVRVLNLPIPVRNPRILTKLLVLDLEAHPPGSPVRRVEVEAIPAKPRIVQNGLFVPLSPEPEKLELTVARLKAVAGEDNVGAAEILDTHRPDAFVVKKFGMTKAPVWRQTRSSAPSLSFRFFRPPRGATVQRRGGVPTWIAFHGAHGPIRTARGPWRTSGDWWRPDTWDREEWDIEADDALYRIYYDVHMDRWYAEGVYD